MGFKKVVNRFRKNVDDSEKEIGREVREAEEWVKERKKFFIKLIWVSALIATLLIISEVYLKGV